MSKVLMKRAASLTIRSLSGHTVVFNPDEPVLVPQEVVAEAMERGAIPVKEDGVKAEAEVTRDVPAHPVGQQRIDLINGVLEAMQVTNSRDDFTAAGMPNIKVVRKRLGFEVSSQEIRDLWEKMVADEG